MGSVKEDNLNFTCDLRNAEKTMANGKAELDNAKLREVSLRTELDGVRERNGELELLKAQLTSSSEDTAQALIRLTTTNKSTEMRATHLESELTAALTKI